MERNGIGKTLTLLLCRMTITPCLLTLRTKYLCLDQLTEIFAGSAFGTMVSSVTGVWITTCINTSAPIKRP
jgi:hypothetical protein